MPRPWQGKNRHRLRRELAYQSRQRFISRASADTTVTPGTASLVLTGFAPVIATPVNVVPGKVDLVLTGFAPTVATPINVRPGVRALTLSTFAPAVATPRLVRPGVVALALTTFAPSVAVTTNINVRPDTGALTLTGYAPKVQGDPIISTDASGGGRLLRESERFPGPPWKPQEFKNDPLPEEVLLIAEPVFVSLRTDNIPAFIALYESGALTEDEFVALLAA